MIIRPATIADTQDVVDVIKAVYDEYAFTWDPETYHADLYDLEKFYFSQGDKFWVAELDGKVVGTVALEFFEELPGCAGDLHRTAEDVIRVAGSDCSLERLYVHPLARRRGVGGALTQTAISEARADNRKAMEIWSDKRFGDAHRLYGRFGARVVGDRICNDPDVSPEWGLILELDRVSREEEDHQGQGDRP